MQGLVVSDVSVRFGRTIALNNLSLDVPRGTTTAIVGPSGCGKSTLLRVIAGLQPADTGTVEFADRSLDGLAPHERNVGLMFQSHALFPHRNVGDNIGFGLKMAGWATPKRAERVAEMLGLVGLDGYESRSVDTLSGGQAQRVALARALAPSPELLLLDEPLGSLDRMLREALAVEVRDLLAELKQTALHVTHDHQEARTVASRVAVMNNGDVLQVGPLSELLESPNDPMVTELLGKSTD